MDDKPNPRLPTFIQRWESASGAERANYTSFLNELCDILDVEKPNPATGSGGAYRYERGVDHHHPDGKRTTRRLDLYKRHHFILEAKQGDIDTPADANLSGIKHVDRKALRRNSPGWAQHMFQAKGQAEQYARDLPVEEGYPPFIIVADIGFCFDIYADFSGTGKHYAPFPDSRGNRLYLTDLARPEIHQRLRAIWTDPLSLDPSRKRVAVTREIATYLAKLTVALEKKGHAPNHVATFLIRCIFSMFAQSVSLLPPDSFTDLLKACLSNPASFTGLIGDLWRTMNAGGFSAAMRSTIRKFNGGLFAPGAHGGTDPLPVDDDMLALLIMAASKNWADVEPAIFGTLLEQALDAKHRGQLGAHFTPRAFVERLVLPTVMEPLRLEWDGTKAAALDQADKNNRPAAAKLLRNFHARLCAIKVLDPACGSGNFLYVTLELMKRLEGEVLDLVADMTGGEGDRLPMAGTSVDPHQFLGIEKNPRAVPVAELVLWIGYLQWHFRTHGDVPPAEPILRDFHNIKAGDALLTYDREEPDRDAQGKPHTRWGGRTKLHPITGEQVPDETDREPILRPIKPKATKWPEADFIVGNPPFIAGKDLRAELGDGYTEALWAAYPEVPRSADLAMHFWWKAAQAVASGKSTQFGFITSNSLTQTFCRRVVSEALAAKKPVHLVFAIADHPWADGQGTAAVRIAFSVAARQRGKPTLQRLTRETASADGVPIVELATIEATINADLTTGSDVTATAPLKAAGDLCCRGVVLHGSGFIISPDIAQSLGRGRVQNLERHIRPYLNGRDLTGHPRGAMVIDLFGLSADEVRTKFPAAYQHVLLHVKPERDQNPRASRRQNWWLFGENVLAHRKAVKDLPRYIATVETTKHRPFVFLDAQVIPDNMLVCIASADAFHLGVLSSRFHTNYALAAGGTLEDRPRYNKSRCFDPFPFPAATPLQATKIRAIAEELDALRKTRLASHPQLTLTLLYNVLEKLRANTPLTPAERDIHDTGHVSILQELHDRLDAAVADAYGWPATLTAPEIVAQIVALNAERRAEEATGKIRWLRPEFQAPAETAQLKTQTALDIGEAIAPAAITIWPKGEAAQYIALRTALATTPATPADLARLFEGTTSQKIATMAETLVALGQARTPSPGRYAM